MGWLTLPPPYVPPARLLSRFLFFFNDTATTEIYTLSLHDALPISPNRDRQRSRGAQHDRGDRAVHVIRPRRDRKSTRLNSSHGYISYAVFCLKKKKRTTTENVKPTQQRTNRDGADAQITVPGDELD